MLYNVLDTFAIGGNTLVTIDGNGDGLKNNMRITDSEGRRFELMSVGMTAGHSADAMMKSTSVLIKGKFASKTIHT